MKVKQLEQPRVELLHGSIRVVMPKQPLDLAAKVFNVSFSELGVFISSNDGISILHEYHKENCIIIA